MSNFNLVKEFGDMFYQGFYFSKAITAAEIQKTEPILNYKINVRKQFSLKLDQAIFDLNRSARS